MIIAFFSAITVIASPAAVSFLPICFMSRQIPGIRFAARYPLRSAAPQQPRPNLTLDHHDLVFRATTM